MDTAFVFIHYDGPKLRRAQKTMVRSTAMYMARLGERNAAALGDGDSTNLMMEPHRTHKHDPSKNQRHGIERPVRTDPHPPVLLRELGQPPEYPQTETGVNGKLYQHYIRLTEMCADLVDEGFLLVGFRKPSLYRPHPDKKLCVYIGWLVATALTDAIRGTAKMVYPYEEFMAIRELGDRVANQMPNFQIANPILMLGLFEIVRLGSHATTHILALKRVVAKEGGVGRLKPLVVRETLILVDLLHAVTFDEPLHFVDNAKPVSHARARCEGEGNFFASSPLVLFNEESFSSLSKFIDAETASPLAAILQWSFDSIEEVYLSSMDRRDKYRVPHLTEGAFSTLDQLADPLANESDAARIILQSCALVSRILFRTLKCLNGLDDSANITDMRSLYRNLKFLGLRSWAGLPYIYAWLLLVGLSAATAHERPFFSGQLARIAASYGGYHLDMLSTFFRNFLYLRRSVSRRASSGVLEYNRDSS